MTMIQTFPAGGGVGVPSGGTKDQALVKNSNTDKDVTWKTITPGHIIEDSAAAATQRDTVQIKGLSISDDSTNQKTVIEGVGLNSDSLDDITSGSINNIFVQPSYDYSTTEKIVGKWIDGKPVYQRTVYIRQTAADADNTVANLDTIDCVVFIGGTCKAAQGDYEPATPVFYTLSATDTAIPGSVSIQIKTKANKIRIIKRGSVSFGVAKDFWITIQYTKTTD